MANTDFFDDDLVKHRSATARKTRGEADSPDSSAPESGTRNVSELNLSRMARHKEQVEDHMATAAKELERLRQKQENLEKEKNQLEDLRRRQSDYERSKSEMIQHLNQSMITLEKQELHTEQLLQLVQEARQRCRGWKGDIDAIDEEQWPEEQFREELGNAIARIDDIRLEFNKILGKISSAQTEEQKQAAKQPVIYDDTAQPIATEKSFADWLKVGFAVSLPIIITLTIIWLLYYMQSIGIL